MTDKQPEALRLADYIERNDANDVWKGTAAELRRLHEVNAELVEACKAMAEDGWLLHGPEGMDEAQQKVYAAIAKATGEQNGKA